MRKAKSLFEIAILLHPSHEDEKVGKSTELLVKPNYILAQDQAAATIMAARQIPDEAIDKLDRVEVAVRPF